MILTLMKKDRLEYAEIFDSMFKARAQAFHIRRGWDVQVRGGLEIDKYDLDERIVYLLTKNDQGNATGSLRILPSNGDMMLKNEFRDLFKIDDGIFLPTVWECTRFCLHPSDNGSVDRNTSVELLAGLCQYALDSGIHAILGVYGREMVPVYKRIGWSPLPIGRTTALDEDLSLGLWIPNTLALSKMESRLRSKQKNFESASYGEMNSPEMASATA